MHRFASLFVLVAGLFPLALAGCGQGYSPNIYASNAAQVEAAVQRGTIIGVRQIIISPDGTIGAAAGGAVGGVAGSQVAGAPVVTALGAIGGTLVGGIGGAAAAQAVGKTKGWEYIVQEEPGDKLVSVTQTSKTALPLGLHVLVIAGTQQARIVPDYTVQIATAAPPAKPAVTNSTETASTPSGSTIDEIDISPVLPASGPAGTAPAPPISVTADPIMAPPPEPSATRDAPATPNTETNARSATAPLSPSSTPAAPAASITPTPAMSPSTISP